MGRHKGCGKRRGTLNARSNRKTVWIFRIRAQRRLIKKFRSIGTIKRSFYRDLYKKSKGNFFKNKSSIVEFIIKEHADTARTQILSDKLNHIRLEKTHRHCQS